jgi:hypothetical protein
MRLGLDWRLMIGLGFALVLVGAIVPWLMVLGYVRSTFALNILSFVASMVGLMLGISGVAFYVNVRRKDR